MTGEPSSPAQSPHKTLRNTLHEIIFEAETPAGKAFDVGLIACILLSVAVIMLDSVRDIHETHGDLLRLAEWGFTILFTVEYVLRLICVKRPLGYAWSFFGVIDLLAIVPTYLSLLLPGSHYLADIRILRMLRIFRVLHLSRYVGEVNLLVGSLKAGGRKIVVFLFAIFTVVVICGSLMFLIEGVEHGFTNIPQSVYWAIVTLTTVGYGDISPQTPLGKAVAALIMILGYAMIIVPMGIVSFEMGRARPGEVSTESCPVCCCEDHDPDASHCKHCGAKL